MSKITPRMGHPYPEQYQEPWYDALEDMVSSLDAHDFASFEDRNTRPVGGGVFAWDAASKVLTWASDIVFITPSTGLLQILPAGSVSIDDVDFFYVELTRGATSTVTLSALTSNKIAPDTKPYVVCSRYGSDLYFKVGVLPDGGSAAMFEGAFATTSLSTPNDVEDTFAGDGVTKVFTLSQTPNVDSIPLVHIDDGIGILSTTGIYSYTLAGTTLTFVTAPPVVAEVRVHYWVL